MTTGHPKLLGRQNQREPALPCAEDRWGSCPGHDAGFSNQHGGRGCSCFRVQRQATLGRRCEDKPESSQQGKGVRRDKGKFGVWWESLRAGERRDPRF